jgi:NTE family protein
MTLKTPDNKTRTGLLLSGGGARAAYQIGVLKAISELCGEEIDSPFNIISGTSAGSINAVALAAHDGKFAESVDRMFDVWSNFQLHHVFKVDAKSLITRMFLWAKARVLPFNLGGKPPPSILDNSPLRELLSNNVDFSQISRKIISGKLDALAVNASSYTNGRSVSFFEANHQVEPWERAYRCGIEQRISIDMLMASSSIPLLFPAVKIDDEYYGDGSMRQNNPLSPLVHLGAKKIMVIGVRKSANPSRKTAKKRPSLANISGFILDTLFLNSLDADLERLARVNELVEALPDAHPKYSKIDHMIISPSEDIGRVAKDMFDTLPKAFRIALKFIGINKSGGNALISYLMFNKPFCNYLIELGYKDAQNRRDEIIQFLDVNC